MSYDRMMIGQEIRKHRQVLGLTQEKAAERADLSLRFYSRVELGTTGMSAEALLKISDALHVTPNDVLFRSFDETPESRWIAEAITTLPPDKQAALVELVQLFLRTF